MSSLQHSQARIKHIKANSSYFIMVRRFVDIDSVDKLDFSHSCGCFGSDYLDLTEREARILNKLIRDAERS